MKVTPEVIKLIKECADRYYGVNAYSARKRRSFETEKELREKQRKLLELAKMLEEMSE